MITRGSMTRKQRAAVRAIHNALAGDLNPQDVLALAMAAREAGHVVTLKEARFAVAALVQSRDATEHVDHLTGITLYRFVGVF